MNMKRKGQVKKVMWTIILGVLGIFVFVTVNAAIGKYALATHGAFVEEDSERIANAIELVQPFENGQLFLDLKGKYIIDIDQAIQNEGDEKSYENARWYVELEQGTEKATSSPFVIPTEMDPRDLEEKTENICITKYGDRTLVFPVREERSANIPLEVDYRCGTQ